MLTTAELRYNSKKKMGRTLGLYFLDGEVVCLRRDGDYSMQDRSGIKNVPSPEDFMKDSKEILTPPEEIMKILLDNFGENGLS